jgi:anti-sigma regulatory factor (Ser/Thr protein kinase)
MVRFLVFFALSFGWHCFAGTCPNSLLPDRLDFVEYESSSPDTTDVIVGQLMEHVRVKLVTLSLSEDSQKRLLNRIEQSLREGVKNAAEWGNGYRAGSVVRVGLRYVAREKGRLGILAATIGDQGEGYNSADVSLRYTGGDSSAHLAERERRGIRPGGQGIYLMRTSAHSAAYAQATATLALHWDLSRAASE